MSGRYYDQFEPAWPGRSVMGPSDIREGYRLFNENHIVGLTPPTAKMLAIQRSAIKLTDEAIAHAIRESHRN